MRENMILLMCVYMYWFDAANGQPFVLPVIINKEQHHLIHASLNETVCLPCEVRSDTSKQSGKVLFYWRKNNAILWPHPRYRRLDNHCLEIRNVEAQDAGYYTCHAHNMHGKDDAERLLVINGQMPDRPASTAKPERTRLPPPIFSGEQFPKVLEAKELATRSVKAGSRLKLACTVSGTPTPSVVWFKDKVRLSSETSTRYLFKTAKLVIKNFKKSDEGNFSCVATNKLGSANVTYVVRFENDRKFTTEIHTLHENLTLRPGDNVTLDCVVKKGDVKILHWYVPTKTQSRTVKQSSNQQTPQSLAAGVFHNRVFIINNTHISRYYLFNVSDEDNGKYTCLAGFRGQKKSFPVKVITISVSEAPVSMQKEDRRGFHMPLFLMISIPLVAGLLCIAIVVVCWKCHGKLRKPTPPSRGCPDDDEAHRERGILGPVPPGSLRVHEPNLQNAKNGALVFQNKSDKLYFSLGHLDLHNRPQRDACHARQVRSSFCLPTPLCGADTTVELTSKVEAPVPCDLSAAGDGNGDALSCNVAQLSPLKSSFCDEPDACAKCRCSDSCLDRLAVDLKGRIRLKSSGDTSSLWSKSLIDLNGRNKRGPLMRAARSSRTKSSCSFSLSLTIDESSKKECLSSLQLAKSDSSFQGSTGSGFLDAGYASTSSPFFFEVGVCAQEQRTYSCDDHSQISSSTEGNFEGCSVPIRREVDNAATLVGEASWKPSSSLLGVVSTCGGECILSSVRASGYNTSEVM